MLKLVGRTCPRFNVPCFADKCSDEHCAAMDQQTITEGQDVTKPKATAPPVKNIETGPELHVSCAYGGKCDFTVCIDEGACMGVKCPHDNKICGHAVCAEFGLCKVARLSVQTLLAARGEVGAEGQEPKTELQAQQQVIPGPCHSGFKRIGSVDKMTLWACNESTLQHKGLIPPGSVEPFALVVSLLGAESVNKAEVVVVGNAPAKKMLPSMLFDPPVPVVAVDWPDYGIPPLRKVWWETFAAALRKVDGHVVIYCLGGHGRTGTAVAILASLLKWVPDKECPVTWLRERYCHQAVESIEQISYIRHITGRAVLAGPSERLFSSWSDDDPRFWGLPGGRM